MSDVLSDISNSALENRRTASLEAVRGVAAIVVVLWHSMLAFYPEHAGLYHQQWPDEFQLPDKWWFAFFNGTAAVILFFVLSGFVLTRRFFLTGEVRIPITGSIKRWPRLLGPVTAVVLVSCSLFMLNAYWYPEAASITGSEWLKTFGNGIAPNGTFTPRISNAFSQGTFDTFFRGSASYDSSLWTMKFELIGSLIVFGFAMITQPLLARKKPWFLYLAVVSIILCYYSSKIYASFLAGAILAALLPATLVPVSRILSISGLAVSLFLFSYSDIRAARLGPLAPLDIQILASVLLIGTALTFNQKILPQGMWLKALGKSLGWISFPIYLVHVPVICSIASATLVLSGSKILAYVSAVVFAFIAAIPFGFFNDWWLRRLNRGTADLFLSPMPHSSDARAS